AAVLGAEEMVASCLCRLEPGCRVAAGNNIGLRPEGRNKVRVDHVLTGHGQPDASVDRDVQLVDLALAVRMLSPPHPLLCGNKYLESLLRCTIEAEIDARPPDKNEHRGDEGDHSPHNLQLDRTFNLRRDFVGSTAAILDCKVELASSDKRSEEDRQT